MVNRSLIVYVALFICAALAHAQPTVLYEKPSLFGTIVVTEEPEGLRVLRFSRSGARQSQVKPGDPEYLGLPYASVMFAGLALCAEPRRMLVVGLGGGTLPMFLRRHYPDAVIDAVDIDPDVVDVAQRFFGFREDGGMRAHVDDGRRFVEQVQRPYDAIFLDAFASTELPAHLTTQEFLLAVRRAIKPDGVVIGNLWGRNSNPLFDAMVRTYQEVFDELFILNVSGADNKILLALPRAEPLSRAELVERARRVSTAKQFRFDLGELVSYGYFRAHVKDQNARVLRDLEQPR